MSKYQTLDALKGNKIIDIQKHFRDRSCSLDEFKSKFGGDQTAADEKFFNEKQHQLREQEQLFRSLAESLGFTVPLRSLDIHISFSIKEKETV